VIFSAGVAPGQLSAGFGLSRNSLAKSRMNAVRMGFVTRFLADFAFGGLRDPFFFDLVLLFMRRMYANE
jgi:hypothetical protein